ncbi:MAG TPA: glycoside hydrolase family 2 TIM barrel-domain containing protein [Solirubrobacter sp.]|nr:glycoside hydrolase family 2 TIM barrel-domain containing protein [Solirubrobacter sp.]
MRYFEDRSPGTGLRAARAWVGDAVSLAGSWAFRRGGEPADFVDRDFDDRDWERVPVPAAWAGESALGLDPPFVPDDNETGDYRRWLSLPAGAPSLLRFEGAGACARVWVNGEAAGTLLGGWGELDVGALLIADAPNLVCVRVHRLASASYVDGAGEAGLYGDVVLATDPGDVFVHADYDHVTGEGLLTVDAADGAPVAVPELGVTCVAGELVRIARVEPWSADVPRLYECVVGEDVVLRIGFRRVAVEDGLLVVNGHRVQLHGVRAGEDVAALKAANVNAVWGRCDAGWLDACDELGLYVIGEARVDTSAFAAVGWRGNPVDDDAWEPMLVDRMRRLVERDKNHPCVIAWSLAAPSGVGAGLGAMARWARRRDPSRPLVYAGDDSCRDVDVYARAFVGVEDVDAIGRGEEPALPDSGLDARRRRLPFVLSAYGPERLEAYQDQFSRHPRCQGGFARGSLETLRRVFAPVRITAGFDGTVRIENLYGFRDLSHLRFEWVLEDEGVPVATGALRVGPLPAGAVAELPLSSVLPPVAGESWLTVRAVLAGDEPWAPAGHEVAWGQLAAAPSAPAEPPRDLAVAPPSGAAAPEPARLVPARGLGAIVLGGGRFDRRTGELRRLGEVELSGPRFEGLLHRTLAVEAGEALVVRQRLLPAGSDVGLHATYTWTVDGGLTLALDVVPDRDWVATPSVVFSVGFERVEWFGRRGDGRLGRYGDAVGTDLRWARLDDRLRIGGHPVFDLRADEGRLRFAVPRAGLVLTFS